MTAACPVCQAPQDDGLVCTPCTDALVHDLASIPALTAELDVTLSRQGRVGAGGKAGKGTAHQRSPIHLGAFHAAAELDATLTYWRRALHLTPDAALADQIAPIRRHPRAAELHADITDAVNRARRAIDRPADRLFLGTCLYVYEEGGNTVTCPADLYARPGAVTTRCQACGITHDVADRRTWLLEQAANRVVTVREAATYLGHIGQLRVTEASIRGYLHRGRIGYRPLGVGQGIRLGDLLAVVGGSGKVSP